LLKKLKQLRVKNERANKLLNVAAPSLEVICDAGSSLVLCLQSKLFWKQRPEVY
jgi:hypothetical protein